MPRAISVEQAGNKAGAFCAYRERSPLEVTRKLIAWGLDEPEAEQVLSTLVNEGFVDEQRFANAYCHDKFAFNSWGKQKIREHISQHLISHTCVEQALSRIDNETYFSKICKLAEKKWGLVEEKDLFKKKQKVLAYLVNKGFEEDWVWKGLASIKK